MDMYREDSVQLWGLNLPLLLASFPVTESNSWHVGGKGLHAASAEVKYSIL